MISYHVLQNGDAIVINFNRMQNVLPLIVCTCFSDAASNELKRRRRKEGQPDSSKRYIYRV